MKSKIILFSIIFIPAIFLSSRLSYSQDTVKSKLNTFIVNYGSLQIIDTDKGNGRIIFRQGCKSLRMYYDGTIENHEDWHIAFYYEDPRSGNIFRDDVIFSEGEKKECQELYDALTRLWKM